MKNLIIFSLVVFCCSCKQEEMDTAGFKYIDIEDAHGIIIGKHTSGMDTSLKLFKLNKTDNLVEVKYYNENKDEVNINRIPVSAYDISESHFLLTYKIGNSNTLESYTVRRFDGYLQKVPTAVFAEISGKADLRTEAIKHDNNSGHYFINSQGNWKLNLSKIEEPAIEEICKGENLGERFTVDYLGNILTREKVYPVSGTPKALELSNLSYTYPLKSFVNSMYYIFRNGDSIQCSQIDVSSSNISEKKLYPSFLLNNAESVYINSHAFHNFNKIVVILSSAIILIEGNSIKKIELSTLNFKKIISGHCSDDYCFLFGENQLNDKIFVRVDLKQIKPVYTQIMAPDEVNIENFSVSHEGNLIFSGYRISDNKKLFGYIPLSGSNWILDDDDGIMDIQLLVR